MRIKNKKVRALIMDMDGVLWRQNTSIGDLPKIFDQINKFDWKVTLATNNATLTTQEYIEKLAQFGVFLKIEQIVNSSQAASRYLSNIFPKGGPVYIIGESGLYETLREKGFYHSKHNVLAVIVGLDRKLDFEKLTQANFLIRSGVKFIGTNSDGTFPVPAGLIPGAGAILAALEVASETKPYIVGKPEPDMYLLAMERMNTKPDETLVIGDRLETDILGGQRLGCPTALVLSGVTTTDAANAWRPPIDFITKDLTTLLATFDQYK